MATITLYRPVGTTELTLIEGLSWTSFPAMPHGHKFYAYRGPPTEILHWREHLFDSERAMYPELGQEDVVKSWEEARLSNAMTSYWASFVREGVPSARGEEGWRPYDARRAYMAFEDAPHLRAEPSNGCELQEAVVCRRARARIPWNWNVGVIAPPLPPRPPECG